MIEQLFKMIQGDAQEEIINNPAIPNEHNNQAVGLATESIFNGLQGALANGGLSQVLNLFGGKAGLGGNPLVSGITNRFVGSMMKQFGIDSPIATSIASSLIPKVLGKLINRTSDPSDNSIDMNGIIGALTGGGASAQQGGGLDFNSILSSLTGNKAVQPNAQGDNSIGLDDIAGLLTGGGQQQSGGGMLGGLLDMVTKGASSQQQQQQQQPQGGVMDLLSQFIK
jgi:hypothetical protein